MKKVIKLLLVACVALAALPLLAGCGDQNVGPNQQKASNAPPAGYPSGGGGNAPTATPPSGTGGDKAPSKSP
jgi:hypothetical protein